ncbi:MAG: sensor histidine kinase [Armatimonadota bacterium]
MGGIPAHAQHTASGQPAANPYLRLARICGVSAILIGISGILGWVLGIPVLNSVIPGYQPIVISTSLVFILLGGGLFFITRPWLPRSLSITFLIVALAITIFGLLEVIKLITGVDVSLENVILRHYPSLFNNPTFHISPVTGVLVLLIGLAQSFILYQRVSGRPIRLLSHVVGLIGSSVMLICAVFLLSYFYRTPLLYSTTYIPISALAALAGLLSGMGLIASMGDTVLPLCWFTGQSMRARLLRAFLPLTALLMLLLSVAQYVLTRLTQINPAFLVPIIVILFEVIITTFILQVARLMGGLIDRAEEERRQAEEELRKSEAQLFTIIENLTEGLIVSTIDGDVFQWNRAALEMHGFANIAEAQHYLPEFTGIFELRTLDGALLPFEQWPLPRILRGETLHDWDVRIRRISTGTERIFSYGGSLVRDTDGQPLMAVLTVTDVTDRRRVEDALRDLNATLEERVHARTAELEASNKELESFSYSVAHDLRSPLRSLDGFSKYLLEHTADRLHAQEQDYLHRMRMAAQRMGRLIDDLLNLARIGRMAMKIEPVDLSTLATGIVTELRQREPTRQVAVEITPGMIVQGDHELLRMAMTHLLDNAWKFTGKRPDACITVGMRTEDDTPIYFVRDNGVGFDMAYINKLFYAFQRLHTEEEFPGTGIGLALVQRIMQRHGGRVWAEGAVGQGATFYFTLREDQG